MGVIVVLSVVAWAWAVRRPAAEAETPAPQAPSTAEAEAPSSPTPEPRPITYAAIGASDVVSEPPAIPASIWPSAILLATCIAA